MKLSYKVFSVSVLLSLLWMAHAQPSLADLLSVEVSVDETTITMGASVFTRAQLEAFTASTQTVLEESRTLQPGETVTLYQQGLQGYISLSAYAHAEQPLFLLSLFAETPVAVETDLGVKALAVLLSETAQLMKTAAVPDTNATR